MKKFSDLKVGDSFFIYFFEEFLEKKITEIEKTKCH